MEENEERPSHSSGAGRESSFPTKSGVGPIEEIGTEIGPYKLLSVLGEGGFGIVYLAEQKHPIRRQVALKLIKPGMNSKQVIARFEQERQALARLDHPNIAHVIDAGTTDKGLPYFVMEYVGGVPITEFCDRKELKIEERLEIFVGVCEAIQHAHQKGIIHRDIKPSNVLVKGGGKTRRAAGRSKTAALPEGFCENAWSFTALEAVKIKAVSAERKGSVLQHGTVVGHSPESAPRGGQQAADPA